VTGLHRIADLIHDHQVKFFLATTGLVMALCCCCGGL
jgi:hypothetical protein